MSFLWYWPAGGWNFEKWKAAHPWTPITSAQSGRDDLLPLVGVGVTRDQWHASRKKWLDITSQILGDIKDAPPTTMKWEFLTDPLTRHGTSPFTMQRLRYTLTEGGEWGYAW